MNEQPFIVSRNISWFQHGPDLFCYHDLVGYILKMSPDIHELMAWCTVPRTRTELVEEFGRVLPEAMIPEIVATLQAHRCLIEPGIDELAELDDLVPVKARWRVAYTNEQGEVTLVLSRTSQEPPRFRKLEPLEAVLWGLLDGQRTVRELAGLASAQLGLTLEAGLAGARQAISSWTHHSAQVVKLHEVPLSFFKGRMHALPPYLTSTMPYPAYDGDPLRPEGLGPTVDLREYHRRDIVDPQLQFDEVETTLNHLFRLPHQALAGRTYPGQMGQMLLERGLLRPGMHRIVEVGGGTGSFAEGFLQWQQQEHPELDSLRYTIVELSPALAASQREKLARFGERARVIAGDAEALDWPPGSVDLLIANEMIGDLRSARVLRDDLDLPEDAPPSRSAPEALAAIRRLGVRVEDGPDEFYLNLGALGLLEQVARLLAPGGCAVLTEFGEEHGYPKESEHLDHSEFSIHFGHLIQAAHTLGLEPHFEFLMDFMQMDRTLRTLATTRPFLRNLQALFASHGITLPKVALTREELATLAGDRLALDRVEGLQFDRIEDRICGLVPHHFKILYCVRPA